MVFNHVTDRNERAVIGLFSEEGRRQDLGRIRKTLDCVVSDNRDLVVHCGEGALQHKGIRREGEGNEDKYEETGFFH